MKFKIVSDSSSNIFSFPGVAFASVPLKINTAAAKLKEAILTVFPKCDILIEPTTALCSFYAERGGLLVGFESK